MFFYLSKLIWALLVPTNLLLLMGLLGVMVAFTRFKRLSTVMMAMSLITLSFIAFSPASEWLMKPLEDRFAQTLITDETAKTIEKIDGIIILGGAVGFNRDQIKLTDQGARMSAGIALWQKHPSAKFVFTGGDGGLLSKGGRWTEAQAAKRFFEEVGLDSAKIIYEDQSRNTFENARFTKVKLNPQKHERWVVVTSAFHMARAVGCFRSLGWDVIAHPVDYETEERGRFLALSRHGSGNLKRFDIAAKEWIGLIAYRLNGYTDTLYPAP